MKTTLLILLLSIVSVFAVPPFQNVTWGLLWDQPTNMPVLSAYSPGTNQAYKLYGTSTVGTPMAQWPLLTLFTNWALITNVNGSIQLSNSITLPFANQYFFMVNPTNVWGEAPLLINYFATAMSGPLWSTVNNSSLNRGP